MKNYLNKIGMLFLFALTFVDVALAEDGTGSGGSMLALGAGIAVGVAALGGTLGQGKVAGSALDSIGRNPSAAGKLQTPMILGLVFIESLVILSFVIAYLLQGKL